MSGIREIKVFIASPGDLPTERRVVREVIDDLNAGFGDGAGCEFIALGWEDKLAATGRRAQGVINRDIDACDVFVLLMWRRWGQEAPDSEYDSYTEEEFYRALDRFKKGKAPEIFVFFKNIEPAQMADPGPQLTKVLAFRKQLQDTRHVLYRNFADADQVRGEIRTHLRAYAKGELPEPDAQSGSFPLPVEAVEKVEQAEAKAKREAERAEQSQQAEEAAAARAEESALASARLAAKAALAGLVEDARQTFATAIQNTSSIQVLFLAYEFYQRTGDLEAAERVLKDWLEISGPDATTGNTAAAYSNLGLVYHTRGELDRAEKMYLRAQAINEALGRQQGIAIQYNNLGLVYRMRGDLDRAEDMHLQSLEIEQKLERPEGIASDYGSLGDVYRIREDFHLAEEMYLKALWIQKSLEYREGMARQYGSLGLIFQARGNLDHAEAMYREALQINEALGCQEGIADQYSNLGLLYEAHCDLDTARRYGEQALALFSMIGAKRKVEETQSWLDRLDSDDD